MTGSYRMAIMQEILRALRQDVTFSPVAPDRCDPIKPSSIVFRKVAVKTREINQENKFDPVFPGIILSTPYSEPFDPGKGEVAHDAYVYHFLAQIVDSDNWDLEANLQTYWKWQEQVCRLFQFNCMSRIDAPHVLSRAVNVDVVDEKIWLREQNFVAGIHITVEVWMTRGST